MILILKWLLSYEKPLPSQISKPASSKNISTLMPYRYEYLPVTGLLYFSKFITSTHFLRFIEKAIRPSPHSEEHVPK